MQSHSKKGLLIHTPTHSLAAELLFGFCDASYLVTNHDVFFAMCRDGCPNFSKKFSCPPCSPDFRKMQGKLGRLLVVMLRLDLRQLDRAGYLDHHRLRLGNAVIKPRLERLMRSLESEFGGRYLATGACRLCKPCQKKLAKPCKHPDKMRFSLEATGVDCDSLSRKVFGLPLEWYKDKRCPDHTAVICALPLDPGVSEDRIIYSIESYDFTH